jgi:ATP-dependent helicase/nuclease subunit A
MNRRDRAGTLRGTPVDNDSEVSRLIGILAHRLLEQWDFAQDPSRFEHRIERAMQTLLTTNQQHLAPTLTASLREMFASFARSDLYGRLRSATILGREIPFVMPWGACQVMEGVIDVLYRFEESLWIADYKTDAVTSDEAAARAERYRAQSQVYKAAAARSLGIEGVRFHCLFLRCATAVEL